MFFFGIFGIQDKQKEIKDIKNRICKSCGTMTQYKLIRVYSYFHFFFVPLFKWNVRYYLKARCCSSIFELEKEIGEKLEQGIDVLFTDNDMKEAYSSQARGNVYYNNETIRCFNCGSIVDKSFKYCPHCGKELK